ncbi:MAG: DNA adenine methylase [Kiritimatiellae bacterium]|nr:DNA adenine methylase [Kiritimatiellia bacterium]
MNLNLTTMEETIMQAHWRLQRVTIERLDSRACIERYDRPETFFYVDPPYYGVSQDYAVKLCEADFLRLRDTLQKTAGASSCH